MLFRILAVCLVMFDNRDNNQLNNKSDDLDEHYVSSILGFSNNRNTYFSSYSTSKYLWTIVYILTHRTRFIAFSIFDERTYDDFEDNYFQQEI